MKIEPVSVPKNWREELAMLRNLPENKKYSQSFTVNLEDPDHRIKFDDAYRLILTMRNTEEIYSLFDLIPEEIINTEDLDDEGFDAYAELWEFIIWYQVKNQLSINVGGLQRAMFAIFDWRAGKIPDLHCDTLKEFLSRSRSIDTDK